MSLPFLAVLAILQILKVGSTLVEKGKIGSCGKLTDFFSSQNYTHFYDITNYPESNYFAKHASRKGKEWAIITCQRVSKSKKKTDPADLAANKLWKSTIQRKRQLGKFFCKNGVWAEKVAIPVCPDRFLKGGWRDHFYKTDWKMWASENKKCLENSNSETMVGFNPATNETGAFRLATWGDCESDGQTNFDSQKQKLTFSLKNKIISSTGHCLSPLPISENIHENLNSCDTLKSNENAGTWLFFVDCVDNEQIDENGNVTIVDDDFQKFDYDKKTKTLRSRCGHGFSISKIGLGKGEVAFLGAEEDGLMGSDVVSGLGLNSVGFK